jgi:hypothetical protein
VNLKEDRFKNTEHTRNGFRSGTVYKRASPARRGAGPETHLLGTIQSTLPGGAAVQNIAYRAGTLQVALESGNLNARMKDGKKKYRGKTNW